MIPGKKQDPYKLTLEHRPGYLHAFVEAENEDYQIAKQYWEEVLDAALAAGESRIMVEYAIQKVATITETFQWVSELAPRASGARIACVDPMLEHVSVHKFSELVAGNRGVTAMAFDNTEDAEKWLLAA